MRQIIESKKENQNIFIYGKYKWDSCCCWTKSIKNILTNFLSKNMKKEIIRIINKNNKN